MQTSTEIECFGCEERRASASMTMPKYQRSSNQTKRAVPRFCRAVFQGPWRAVLIRDASHHRSACNRY